MAVQESEREFAVQIMVLLTQQQARPDIPPLDSLPGPPLPGIEEYLQLMQVFHTLKLLIFQTRCRAGRSPHCYKQHHALLM
jgi:hypothetical protein